MAAKRSTSRARRSPAAKKGPKKVHKKSSKKAPKKAPKKASKKASSSGAAPKPKRKKASRKRAASSPPTRVDGQVEQIQRVIDVMVAAGAVEVELEDAGTKLRVRLKEDRPVTMVASAEPRAAVATALEVPGVEAAPAGAAPEAAPTAAVGDVFESPMVGTFYRAPSPDAEPFVKEGDMVTADTVLCIIEAMKVMNEIKAEMDGQIVEITAQSGEPVEFGQPLFTIKS